MSTRAPAWAYECPKGTGGIHSWERSKDGTATCGHCRLLLTKDEAEDCFRGADEERARLLALRGWIDSGSSYQ